MKGEPATVVSNQTVGTFCKQVIQSIMPTLKSETLLIVHYKFENDNCHIQPSAKLQCNKSIYEQDEF